MKLPEYFLYDAIIDHSPSKYTDGNGYYYSRDLNRGLGFGYTEWFQNLLSGEYTFDNYHDNNLIFNI